MEGRHKAALLLMKKCEDCCGEHKYTGSPIKASIWGTSQKNRRLLRKLYGGRFNFFRGFGCEAVSPIIANRLVDERAAIDKFPGIKDQEKI